MRVRHSLHPVLLELQVRSTPVPLTDGGWWSGQHERLARGAPLAPALEEALTAFLTGEIQAPPEGGAY